MYILTSLDFFFQALYRRMPTSETEYIKETIVEQLTPWVSQKVDSNYVNPQQYTVSRASRFSYPSNQGVYTSSRAQVKPLQVIVEVEYKPIPNVSKPS